MKRASVIVGILGAVGLAGLLTSCSDGSPSASASAGGASGSGSASASGTVTGFGSIIVNGKRFETEAASVSIDDQPSSQCAVSPTNRCGLQEGMTVKVSGSFNGSTNRAANIVQEDTLEGPITSVDFTNSQFAVLGQMVLVDDTTKFDSGLNFAALVAGNVVEVSGFVKSDGVIAASFIERKALVGDCSLTCEIKGVAKNHDHVTTRFEIGGLTVIYNNTTLIDNSLPLPNGSNWNGLFVEVKGVSLVGSTLTATRVERENDGVGNGNVVDEFEVEGFVTQAGTPNGNVTSFTIGTTPVQTTANTEFRGGTVDEIVVGAKMSAEGRFDGTTLIARHVKFHESVRLEGDIETIGTNSLTLKGLPGITVTVNSQTEFKANGGATINNLSDLAINNHIRVRGRVSGTNSVIATRIQLRSPDNDVDLQGPVQLISGTVIEILGVSVDLSAINQFESVSGTSMSRTAFLAEVQVNSLVKVKGTWNGTAVNWDEAELED